jgi:hypothetical protein
MTVWGDASRVGRPLSEVVLVILYRRGGVVEDIAYGIGMALGQWLLSGLMTLILSWYGFGLIMWIIGSNSTMHKVVMRER